MSSKRFGAMKDFARAKKPRLDVSVARASSRPSPPRNIIDFWDDDDDVILMATQLAEAEIEAEAKRKADATNITAVDITFSEFAPVRGTTSTQQMFPPAAPPKQKTSSIDMDAIFGDDEDFDFLAMALTEDVPPPATPPPPQERAKAGPTTTSITIQQTKTQITATQTRQQEHQIKFLLDRIESLKKDNSKLQKDLGDSNERTEIKSGEVSLLRDELRHVRQQLQASKMEKLALAEETNNNCNQKVAEAAKQIAAKEIELTMKNAENTKLRIQQQARRAHDKTMNGSISMLQAAANPSEQRALLRLHKLNIHQTVPRLMANNASVYEYSEAQEKGKKQGTLFEVELKQLLLNYAQLQSQPESVYSLVQRIVCSVRKVFSEFASYAQGLEFPHNCMLYPHNPYVLHTHTSVSRHSLAQPGALYTNERALLLRRYIATLALICGQQGKIARAVLRQRHNDLWLLELAIDAVVKLGFSYEVSEHFGLLEATASLLLSLLRAQQQEEQRVEELLVELLKQLVFTRPSPWVFGELSACLLACLKQPQLLARLCVNSPKSCFISDRVRSVYRFGPSACLLQVYAGLLELCFFSETALQVAHFQLLLSIGGNHVRFAFECFKNPPDFILEMLPFFADDGEADANEPTLTNKLSSSSTAAVHGSASNGSCTLTSSDSHSNSNSSSSRNNCECYVKLCLSVVTLVFQMMHQWMLHQRKIGTEQVGEMSRIAVHLLTLVFHEYYLTCLFRDSEETTKHYLSLICNWWSEHSGLLGFQPIHLRLLSQLEKSHFMLKPLHQEANRSNPSNDLVEWTRIINRADARTENVAPHASDAYKLLEIDFFGGLKRVDYTFD
ncbi:ATR-interacting protein mus304 [Drosophila guanche]|uniref:Blast:ATR-interacting protein mus304 n=1 Tax=Drosophila guanche TaxID=7266 RepID=A0A3B0J9J7_DROGU|nr:ATR-interacting protein mus304 [Drosophila guanche]SPP77033.1 blast:ATR-interacting protein mus304 [Drosophila guanche]